MIMTAVLALVPALRAQGTMRVAFGDRQSYYNLQATAADPVLEETSNGVYEGVFNITSNRPTFIFYLCDQDQYTFYGRLTGYYMLDVEDGTADGTIEAGETSGDVLSGSTLHAWRLMGITSEGAHVEVTIDLNSREIMMKFADGLVENPTPLPGNLHVATSDSAGSITANPATDALLAGKGDGTYSGAFDVDAQNGNFLFYAVGDYGYTFYSPVSAEPALEIDAENPTMTILGFMPVKAEDAEYSPVNGLYSIANPAKGTVEISVNLLTSTADLTFKPFVVYTEYFILTSTNGGAAQNIPVALEATETPGVFTYTCDVPECDFKETLGGSDGITLEGTGFYFMFTNERSIGSTTLAYGVSRDEDDIEFGEGETTVTRQLVEGTAINSPGWIINQTPGKTRFDLDMNERILTLTLLDTTVVDGVEVETPKRVVIYNLQGVPVGRSVDENALNHLPQGIYVVNGRKVFKR